MFAFTLDSLLYLLRFVFLFFSIAVIRELLMIILCELGEDHLSTVLALLIIEILDLVQYSVYESQCLIFLSICFCLHHDSGYA